MRRLLLVNLRDCDGYSVEMFGWATHEADQRSGCCVSWISGVVLFGQIAKGRVTQLIAVELLLALVAARYLKSVDYRTARRNRLLVKPIADTMSFQSCSLGNGGFMAKNTGDGFRRGSVTGRTQFQRPDGQWQKRDERTGQLMEVKSGDQPFKGVAKEPDGRDTPNA